MNFLIKLKKEGKVKEMVEVAEKFNSELFNFIENLGSSEINQYREKIKVLLK